MHGAAVAGLTWLVASHSTHTPVFTKNAQLPIVFEEPQTLHFQVGRRTLLQRPSCMAIVPHHGGTTQVVRGDGTNTVMAECSSSVGRLLRFKGSVRLLASWPCS